MRPFCIVSVGLVENVCHYVCLSFFTVSSSMKCVIHKCWVNKHLEAGWRNAAQRFCSLLFALDFFHEGIFVEGN